MAVLTAGSAHAAAGDAAAAVRAPATVIVAADQRATNLRKTATSIVVMGAEAPRKR